MSNSLLHRCGRLLLSVVMIASSGVSPGVTHAHTDAASSHTHAADSVKSSHRQPGRHHHHHHSHPHVADHHAHSHNDVALVEDGAWHTHLSFFGWPISIPTSHGKQAEVASDASALAAEIVASPVDLRSAASALSLQPHSTLPTAATLLITDSCPSSYHPPNAYRALLCDTARRERSGVLLA